MTFQFYYKNIDFTIINTVYYSVVRGDMTRVYHIISSHQWLWMTDAVTWIFCDGNNYFSKFFVEKRIGFLPF